MKSELFRTFQNFSGLFRTFLAPRPHVARVIGAFSRASFQNLSELFRTFHNFSGAASAREAEASADREAEREACDMRPRRALADKLVFRLTGTTHLQWLEYIYIYIYIYIYSVPNARGNFAPSSRPSYKEKYEYLTAPLALKQRHCTQAQSFNHTRPAWLPYILFNIKH
jgi:hypothetical protein